MQTLLTSIGFRLLACGAVAALLWKLEGLVGVVVSAPLFGVLLARPLLDLLSELRHSTRALALSDIQGLNFEHRGYRIGILEDVRHHRWIKIDDLRKLLPALPRAAVLQRQFPQGILSEGGSPGQLIHAEALLYYLRQTTEPESVRLRNWLDREVVRPAAKIRQRLGIRDDTEGGSDASSNAP